MKISTRLRYALVAMVDLAVYGSRGYVSISNIAHRNNISIAYLEQLFLKLKSSSLVISSKGIKGGYMLSRDSKKIYLNEIISAVDKEVSFSRCTNVDCCIDKEVKCKTHSVWNKLETIINDYIKKISLYEIVDNHCLDNIVVHFNN